MRKSTPSERRTRRRRPRRTNREDHASLAAHRRCRPGGGLPHGSRLVPAPDPVAEFAKARAEFRSGNFGKALVSFRRLTYELGPSQPEMADVRYHLAECYFQTGDRVQAAHEFREVA